MENQEKFVPLVEKSNKPTFYKIMFILFALAGAIIWFINSDLIYYLIYW